MEEIKSRIDVLYGKVYQLNKTLLEKSEKKRGDYSCTDVMDFYITSHALSYLKDIYFSMYQSAGMHLNARCILEGLAVKRYCMSENSKAGLELLRHQTPILEHKLYMRFKDELLEQIMIPEDLEKAYNDSVAFYKKELSNKYSDSTIGQIIDSPIPFICCPRTNFRRLIGEQLGENYAVVYGLLSQMIHPSVNDTYNNDTLIKLPADVLPLIEKEYSGLCAKKQGLRFHSLISLSAQIPDQLIDLENKERLSLIKIAETIEKYFKKNYISDTLQTLYLLKKEMLTDTLMGLKEQTKIKWKVFLDLLSVFYEMKFVRDGRQEEFDLLCRHAEMQLHWNLKEEIDFGEAYSTYLSVYPDGVVREKFENGFRSMTGYLIDEKGRTKTLSKTVKDFLAVFRSDSAVNIENSSMLDYLESQLMSHANGYMFFANGGAWGDVNNILIGADYLTAFILNGVLSIYEEYDREYNSGEYKSVISALKSGLKTFSEVIEKKVELFNKPAQNLNTVM